MTNKRKATTLWADRHLSRITIIMLGCSTLYYLDVIASLVGWTALQNTLVILHDFWGLPFFAPVVYAAYIFGIRGAILTALITMLILLPYSISTTPFPDALFKPTAFVLILSALGSTIAMLQRSDEERRRNMDELKCLYDVGRAAGESDSIEGFLSFVMGLVPRTMQYPEETKVRITVRDKVLQNPDFAESPNRVMEHLTMGGELLGNVEICCTRKGHSLKKQYPFVKTLVERMGGAVRKIELEQSLKLYSERLEEMVKERTRDLEQAQDKLIRSERLAAVGELASGVGHELRNPLNVLKNCVYLLNMTLGDKTDEDTLTTLRILDQQVDISNKIITDLLDFTRVRPASLAGVDLNSLVRQSLSWAEVPEGIVVKTDLEEVSPQVIADSEQIGRAFTNIISNAAQSMNGKGELKVSTGIDDGCAWVEFGDTGCGIPEENLKRIFEPLFTTRAKGIGLGLAITRRLIEQNNGAIDVASEVAKGTTFTIKLPLEKEVNIS